MHGLDCITRIKGIPVKTDIIFFILSRTIFLRIRNVSDKSCRENHVTHFMFSNIFSLRKSCCLMWKNVVEPGMIQLLIRRTRIACWIPKATNTHSEYVILIAFSLQESLHERSSML